MKKEKVLKFSQKNLAKSIEDISKWEPKKESKDCSICKNLKNSHSAYQESRNTEDNSYLPKVSEKLEKVWQVEHRDSAIKKCPECDQLYSYTYSTSWYTSSGHEDEEHLKKISKTEIPKIIKERLEGLITPKRITHRGDFWEINFYDH